MKKISNIKKKVKNVVGTVIAGKQILASKKAIKESKADAATIKYARKFKGASSQVPGAVEAKTARDFAEIRTKKRNAKWAKKK